jgi:hypothetical protein
MSAHARPPDLVQAQPGEWLLVVSHQHLEEYGLVDLHDEEQKVGSWRLLGVQLLPAGGGSAGALAASFCGLLQHQHPSPTPAPHHHCSAVLLHP